jgi:hypothetical protein
MSEARTEVRLRRWSGVGAGGAERTIALIGAIGRLFNRFGTHRWELDR